MLAVLASATNWPPHEGADDSNNCGIGTWMQWKGGDGMWLNVINNIFYYILFSLQLPPCIHIPHHVWVHCTNLSLHTLLSRLWECVGGGCWPPVRSCFTKVNLCVYLLLRLKRAKHIYSLQPDCILSSPLTHNGILWVRAATMAARLFNMPGTTLTLVTFQLPSTL